MPEPIDSQDSSKEPTEDKTVAVKVEELRALKEAAKAAEDAKAAMRENAMLKAGIDIDSPVGKMFFKTYEGELSKDAIKQAAVEVGLAEVETKNPEVTPDEKNSTKERQGLTTGVPGSTEVKKHPIEEAKETADDFIKKGATFEDAGAAYVSTLVKRYQEGDKRAVIERNRGGDSSE